MIVLVLLSSCDGIKTATDIEKNCLGCENAKAKAILWVDRKNGESISLGRQTAERDDELMYGQVPSGALYWLRNLTRGKEERIFGHEDGKQVWY